MCICKWPASGQRPSPMHGIVFAVIKHPVEVYAIALTLYPRGYGRMLGPGTHGRAAQAAEVLNVRHVARRFRSGGRIAKLRGAA